MIPWVTYGNYLKGILKYNSKKVDTEDATLLYVNTFDNKIDSFKRNFDYLSSLNKRVKNNIMHISLNFSPDDHAKINDTFCRTIATDFLSQYGIPIDHPYVIYQHKDKSHPHLHLVVPMTLADGSRVGDKGFPALQMQKICRKLEEKYNIVKVIDKKRAASKKKEELPPLNNHYTTASTAINSTLNKIFLDNPTSENELIEKLNKTPFYYNDEKCTIKLLPRIDNKKNKNGYSFILENEQSQQVSKRIKGSSVHYSFSTIEKTFAKNIQYHEKQKVLQKELAPYISKKVTSAFAKSIGQPIEHFTALLLKSGIQLQLSISENTGEIFGWNFIDLKTNFLYKGSELKSTNPQIKIKSFSYQQVKNNFVDTPKKSPNFTSTKAQTQEPTAQNKAQNKRYTMENIKDIFNHAKQNISIVEVAQNYGYKVIDGKPGVSKWITLRDDKHDTIVVASNDKKYNFYFTQQNNADKGSIIDFLQSRHITQDHYSTAEFLQRYSPLITPIPASSDNTKNNAETYSTKSFSPIPNLNPVTENDYITTSQNLSKPFVDKHNTLNNIHSISIEKLSAFFESFYGKPMPDSVLKHKTNCTVYDMFDIRNTSSQVIGQAISNKPIASEKSFKHILSASNKNYGAWFTSYENTKPLIICESPSKALAYMQLHSKTEHNAFATFGNPSKSIIEYLSSLSSNKTPLILGGDNDISGQIFNLSIITNIIATQNNLNLKYALSSNEIKLTFQNSDRSLNHIQEKIFKQLAVQANGFYDTETNTLKFKFSKNEKENIDIIYQLNQLLIQELKINNLHIKKPIGKDFNDDILLVQKNQVTRQEENKFVKSNATNTQKRRL